MKPLSTGHFVTLGRLADEGKARFMLNKRLSVPLVVDGTNPP